MLSEVSGLRGDKKNAVISVCEVIRRFQLHKRKMAALKGTVFLFLSTYCFFVCNYCFICDSLVRILC